MFTKTSVSRNVLRVAIYIRVSTKMQEEKYSLNAQKVELTRYAESQGWEVIGIFRDVDSGTKLKKDGLEAMLDCVEDGKVDVVLCIEQDRLSRLDTMKWEYLKGILRENNVKIAEPGNITDLSNANDEFISDLKNLIAQRTRKDLLHKMNRGKRQKTREGKVWGRQPDEYRYDKETQSAVIIEEHAWIIPYIDDLYLEKGYGASRIAKELNKISRTPNGNLWTSGRVLSRLKSKAYHGVLERSFSNGETITIEHVYPPLRTEETFERIQRKLKGQPKRKAATPHFLRDVKIICSACGRKLGIKKNYVTGPKEHQKYTVYQLLHARDGIHELCKYEHEHINLIRLRNPVISAIRGILTDENSAKQFIDSDFDENELSKLKAEMKRLNKQKQSIQEQIDRLLPLYLSGRWSPEQLDTEKDKLDLQLKEISDKLEEVSHKHDLIQQNEFTYDTVVQFLSVAERFDVLLDELDQQKLIGEMFPSATLDIENDLFTLHARLPQNVTFDVKVRIATTEEAVEKKLYEKSEKRYQEVQAYLNSHPGIGLIALARATGHGISTLKEDQERFGPFKNLAVNKLSPEFRQKRIELIKAELSKDPTLTITKLEELTGINRKMISKILKEESLRK